MNGASAIIHNLTTDGAVIIILTQTVFIFPVCRASFCIGINLPIIDIIPKHFLFYFGGNGNGLRFLRSGHLYLLLCLLLVLLWLIPW